MTLERRWDQRVEQWHSHVTSAAAFEQVLRRLIQLSSPKPTDACVDLGAGTGFVTTALAPLVSSVLAVDISAAMAASLAERAARDGLRNVSTQVSDLKEFNLMPASADLVVSSYVLHHLSDPDKRALVARAARWLRPGGRLVIADMMFGRGASQRDRDILRQKVLALAAKGPGGWWRIAKNLTRYGLGLGQEHPATPEFWQAALRDAEFTEVVFQPVIAEAGVVYGIRPGHLAGHAPRSVRGNYSFLFRTDSGFPDQDSWKRAISASAAAVGTGRCAAEPAAARHERAAHRRGGGLGPVGGDSRRRRVRRQWGAANSHPVREPPGQEPPSCGQPLAAAARPRGPPNELVRDGAFAAAEQAAERVEARLGVVLARPLVQGAAGGEVIAAGRAPGGALGQVPERLHHPLRAHVA